MKARLTSLIVIVLLLSLLLSNCAPAPAAAPEPVEPPAQEQTEAPVEATEAPATEAAKPPAPEYIELGASNPLTGPFGSLGNLVLPGYEFAVEDINAAGGVYGEEYGTKIPLRFTYYDDESDPTKAVSKMETLYSDQNVTAYLGGAGSSMHAATTAIAEKNKVPYCGISFALYQIHQQGREQGVVSDRKSPRDEPARLAKREAEAPQSASRKIYAQKSVLERFSEFRGRPTMNSYLGMFEQEGMIGLPAGPAGRTGRRQEYGAGVVHLFDADQDDIGHSCHGSLAALPQEGPRLHQ